MHCDKLHVVIQQLREGKKDKVREREREGGKNEGDGRKERNVLFNDTLNTFYL